MIWLYHSFKSMLPFSLISVLLHVLLYNNPHKTKAKCDYFVIFFAYIMGIQNYEIIMHKISCQMFHTFLNPLFYLIHNQINLRLRKYKCNLEQPQTIQPKIIEMNTVFIRITGQQLPKFYRRTSERRGFPTAASLAPVPLHLWWFFSHWIPMSWAPASLWIYLHYQCVLWRLDFCTLQSSAENIEVHHAE